MRVYTITLNELCCCMNNLANRDTVALEGSVLMLIHKVAWHRFFKCIKDVTRTLVDKSFDKKLLKNFDEKLLNLQMVKIKMRWLIMRHLILIYNVCHLAWMKHF